VVDFIDDTCAYLRQVWREFSGKFFEKKLEEEKQNIKMIKILQIFTVPTSKLNKQIDHFKTTFHNLNSLLTYKYILFNTTLMCPRSIAGCLRARHFRASLLLHLHLCAFLM